MEYSWFRPRPQVALERPLVLVVDGRQADRHHLMRALGPLDVAPLGFAFAEEALTWLSANRAPALIAVDLVLPRMSGATFCERVRQDARLARVPILATSSRTGTEDEARALEADTDAFLEKPLHLAELLGEARRLLRGRSGDGLRSVS